MLTASLLLLADFLGFYPDAEKAEIEHRKSIAESLAVQLSTALSNQELRGIESTLLSVVERNSAVLSAALRQADGKLLFASNQHRAQWKNHDNTNSTTSHIQVSIFDNSSRWGNIELSFEPIGGSFFSLTQRGSVFSLVLFVTSFGFLGYTLLLRKVLHELNTADVFPERVSNALDSLTEGILLLDKNGTIIFANAAFSELLGTTKASISGLAVDKLDWKVAASGAHKTDLLWQQGLQQPTSFKQQPVTLIDKQGEQHALTANSTTLQSADGVLQGALMTFDDISAIEHKNHQLEQALHKLHIVQQEVTAQNKKLLVLATRDPLTNALNRRALLTQLDSLIAECSREGAPLCFVMIDIDHFKSVNDNHGHAVGDKVIQSLVHSLALHTRAEDLLARLGGEEFCVVLPNTDVQRGSEIAEGMRETVENSMPSEAHPQLRISASFGVSALSPDSAQADALMDAADTALYQAKTAGRNRVVLTSKPNAARDSAKAVGTTAGQTAARLSSPAADPVQPPRAEQAQAHEQQFFSDAILHDSIEQAIARCRGDNHFAAVFSIDIEWLQRVHDTLGAESGQRMTREICQRLKTAIRSTDTISLRSSEAATLKLSLIGHRELVLLLPDLSNLSGIENISQRITHSLQQPITLDDHEINCDASVGVSLYPLDGQDSQTLLKHAAVAKNAAMKTATDSALCFYSDEIDASSRRQIELETDLQHAIENRELVLLFQPKVDLVNGSIKGFEALLRWHHPQRGLIPPTAFIHIAEKTGFIHRLSSWVVVSACHQIRSWKEQNLGDVLISVNLSPIEFKNKMLSERILTEVTRLGINPSCLEVEITESIALDNMDSAIETLNALSQKGIAVSIDDFGTGFASMSYLQQLPLDKIKIDRSFIQNILDKQTDAAIVSGMINLGHSLGLEVIAEGIENVEQMRFLQDLHCDQIQGYLLGRPMSRQDAESLLRDPSSISRQVVRNNAHAESGVYGHLGTDLNLVNHLP